MNYAASRRILAAFEEEGVRYLVFGGAAMNLHGLPRFTEDLDVFIEPTRENVEAVKRALRKVYDDPNIDEISADELVGEYPAVQYVPPEGDFHLDILTRLGEAFRFEDLEPDETTLDGVKVRLVSPRTLYLMKKGTVRPKDRLDADGLRAKYGFEEP
ncbi:MAG: nucleotidyl transferase AbiEii/AbiGii toxin family protein [Thermoanaerobaculia bacterium]|nr:nucleotidyl transferase AbiEii/AbiGii toxin family protein [Thermoanaerobaculia bacterium]